MAYNITAFAKAGAALALAASTLTACDDGSSAAQSVHAVGSSTVLPFAKLVAENFTRSHTDMRSPLIESTGTGNGIQLFCSGLGPNTPDMVNASRRMKESEFDTCASNKVDEIVEIQVGLDGIAFASAKGGIMLNLTPETVYKALAAQPYGKPQTAKTWKDVDPALPADPIIVYGPPSTSGTRDALKELILEAGCKKDPAMKALKESDEDKYKQICTEVRDDGAYVDQGEQDNLVVQKIKDNPKVVGIFGYSYLEENLDKVQDLPMNGVPATYENIASFKYPGARPLYVYVKKAHMRAIPGLQDFMKEWAKSWGKDGPLVKVGMVAMPDDVAAANALKVQNLPVLTRAELAPKK
ncbi:substrate-binding domain-containing protein [Erythrobacter sp. BLCC-B19]|uniref:substrate-binding domain-containing protein n=1 Tax=Erythrobacter sp. BLCC-B19 TaxID=3025315 RepID=UPI00235ECF3F|nr:substrate-binding domain-containing protein [Erythrobacter sp. BLCC-B19]WDA42518.1 substrate-binding domain-containing protein [Erythrobacter sp. BLCC-B19]